MFPLFSVCYSQESQHKKKILAIQFMTPNCNDSKPGVLERKKNECCPDLLTIRRHKDVGVFCLFHIQLNLNHILMPYCSLQLF